MRRFPTCRFEDSWTNWRAIGIFGSFPEAPPSFMTDWDFPSAGWRSGRLGPVIVNGRWWCDLLRVQLSARRFVSGFYWGQNDCPSPFWLTLAVGHLQHHSSPSFTDVSTFPWLTLIHTRAHTPQRSLWCFEQTYTSLSFGRFQLILSSKYTKTRPKLTPGQCFRLSLFSTE